MPRPELHLTNVAAFLDVGRATEGATELLVRDGLIAAIGRQLTVPAGVTAIDCSRRLVAPGLVNGHWHSPMQTAHGTADRLDHKRFMWLNQADTANRSPEEVTISALLGCIQMIRSGTTSVIDHFPEQHFGIGDVRAVVEAFEASGMRAVVALRIFDGPYADIMPAESQGAEALHAAIRAHNPLVPRTLEASLALVEECIASYDGRAGRVRVYPAPSNPVRCSDAFLVACQALAEKYDTGVHCHLLETSRQADLAQAAYGRTMVAHMAELGVLTDRWSCAHCNWLTAADIALMADHGTVAVLNPESNLKLGSGVPPIPQLLQAGVHCALGTDGASTNDNLALHDALQLATLLHRVSEPDRSRWIGAADAIAMATVGGAAAMREPALGRIAVGQKADLALYDLNAPCWVPLNDVPQQFVFGERGSGVRSVIIDGRLVMHDGCILSFDEAAVLDAARSMFTDRNGRNPEIRSIADAFEQAV